MKLKTALVIAGVIVAYATLNCMYEREYEDMFKLFGNFAIGWTICDIVTNIFKE